MVFASLISGMHIWVTGWDDNKHPILTFHRDFVDASRVKTLLSMLGVGDLHNQIDGWNYENRSSSFSMADTKDVLFAGSSSAIMRFLINKASWCVFSWDPDYEFEDTLRLEKVYHTSLKHITMVLPSALGPLGVNSTAQTELMDSLDGQELGLGVVSHFLDTRSLKTMDILVTVNSDNVGNLFHACSVSNALFETWQQIIGFDEEIPLLGASYDKTAAIFDRIGTTLTVTARFIPADAALYQHEVRKSYSTIPEDISDIFMPLDWSDFEKSEEMMGRDVASLNQHGFGADGDGDDDEMIMLDLREELRVALARHWRFDTQNSLRFEGRRACEYRWVPDDPAVHGEPEEAVNVFRAKKGL